MSAHRLLIAALLAFLLTCGWVWGQTNLPIPVNHTGTGTAIGANLWPETGFNVWLFNAKDQPSVPDGNDLRCAYWHSGSVSGSLAEELMENSEGTAWALPLYPSVITRGGRVDQDSWTESVAAVYRPERYTGQHWGANWNWDDRTPPWATEPITCATTGRWEEGASWNVVVGLDRIADETADHYFERSSNGGESWERVPNTGDDVVPNSLAMTDVAIEDATLPNKLVAVAAGELDPVQNGELPLITNRVKIASVCWTSNLRDNVPRWTTFDPAPANALWNLQIAMKDHLVYGLACHEGGDQVLYSATFAHDVLEGWAPVEVNPEHPLPDGIPYDLEFGPMVGNDYTLLATSQAGLYYSPDNGEDWYPATSFSADVIRTPELRRMCIQLEEGEDPNIVLAGWYASYVGKFDATAWDFTLQEISYDPTVLNLYQNRNQAWCGLSLPLERESADFALIDYSSDPYFPNDSAVVVQVDGPDLTPKNVFLGYQDHDTRPYMRMTAGTGRPWVVYEQQGTAGVVARTALEPDYLTWDEVEIFNDPEGTVHRVLDAASCPRADYVVLQDVGPNRLWERAAGQSQWIERPHPGIETSLIAPTSDGWVYGVQRVNNHLAYSTDSGSTFTNIPREMHGDWSSISVGFDSRMPLYGGTVDTHDTSESYSWIYRYDPAVNLWTAGPLDNVVVTQIVADPYFKDVFFVACRTVAPDNVPMFQLGTYLGGEPAVFGRAGLWKPIPSTAQDSLFEIRDIQLVPTSENGRDVYVTLRTPDSNAPGIDHTVVKRWQFNILAPDVTIPATLSGQWIVAGDVTIAAWQTLAVEGGASLMFLPGAKLFVEGTLRAEGELGKEIVFGKVATDQSGPWEGIYVEGICELSYCTIEGAVTGLKSVKAESLTVTNCTFQDNETGLDFYQPPGVQTPEITNCVVSNNEKFGIVLTGSASATVVQCQINNNGQDGVLLIDSYAKMHENQIRENGTFGVECYGSSPVLYCNNFQNNRAGEIGLFKDSYPVLWDEAQGVGANSFMNDDTTLITMESSAPVVVKGRNDFYVGETGYFMADLSAKPVKHDLSDNYWSPNLSLDLLYPHDPAVWTWGGVAESPSNCGTPKGELSGLAGVLFEEGFEAEMSGNIGLAQTKYTQLLTQYPDSAWSVIAATRRFETQRQLDSAYTTLQAFYDTLASNHSEDTLLANAAHALATRLWVEDGQFDPALVRYQQVIQNPPSSMDSVYAALDYSVTALRAQIEDSGGNLDSYAPCVSAASIGHLVGLVRHTLPTAPPTLHAGYSLPPSNFVLEQNYPNPFNPSTTIAFDLPKAGHISLRVFDLLGREVAVLKDGFAEAGTHRVTFDGSGLASGIYFARLNAGDFSQTKKLMLLK